MLTLLYPFVQRLLSECDARATTGFVEEKHSIATAVPMLRKPLMHKVVTVWCQSKKKKEKLIMSVWFTVHFRAELTKCGHIHWQKSTGRNTVSIH
jgi:hypothetical protein